MPRLDDPNTKLKNVKIFERASVRPWDDAEKFKPTLKIAENLQNNIEATVNSDELVNKSNPISKQKDIQLVNNWKTKDEPFSNPENASGLQESIISKQLDLNKKTISKPNGNQLINKNSIVKEEFYEVLNKIKTLVGLQKILLCFITENCRSRGLLYTDKMTNELLRELLKTDAHSVKTTVQRLINKGLVIRKEGKRGKGGFTVFEIHEITRNAVIDEQRQINISQQFGSQLKFHNINQMVNDLETKKATIFSSSSSYNNIPLTTYNEENREDNPIINIEPLNHIGLTYSHIIQLTKQQKLTVDQIQDSINYFAFDLFHNDKAKTLKKDPLNFFIGILRQGIPYTPPSNYESPEAEAMRLYLKSKAETKQINDQLEKEVKENAWQEWLEGLGEFELMEFYVPGESLDSVPEKVRITLKKRNAVNHAQQYFESEVWPSKRKEILTLGNGTSEKTVKS